MNRVSFILDSDITSNKIVLVKTMVLEQVRIPLCSNRGPVRVSADVAIPIVFVPGMILLAASGPIWTGVVFITFPLIGYYVSTKFKIRNPRTPVYLVWALSSAIFLLGVMELEVIPYMEIYLWENLLLKFFVGALLACVYEMRKVSDPVDAKNVNGQQLSSDPEIVKKCTICNIVQTPRSSHCRYCSVCVIQRDHHCFWIDACIGARNHKKFLLGLLFLICANYYGAMLTLTTVCQPILILDFILIPTDCSGVYDDIHLAVCFVSAIYAALIAAVGVWALFRQIYLVSINVTMEESRTSFSQSIESNVRRSHSKGFIRNWCLFLQGQR